jgi:DNA-binding CsgD family transcriptional regulator
MNSDHWYILYFFITFTIGIFSIGITAITYFKTKYTLIRNYLYFFLAFTLLIMNDIFFSYVDANFPLSDGNDFLFTFLESVELIAIHLLMFTIPLLMHDIFSVSRPKLRNRIVGIITILCYGVSQVFEIVDITGKFSEIGVPDILLLVVVTYSFLSGLYLYKTLQDPLKKRSAQKMLILLVIALAVVLEDSFQSLLPSILLYPMLYCGISVVLAHHFITHYLHQPHVSSEAVSAKRAPGENHGDQDRVSAESIFEQYGISPREQEVLILLLQGHTNIEIGKTLYISLSTVKAHVRKIFGKCAITNRYELITLFKHVTLPTSNSNENEDRAENSQKNRG